jgi:hypothetical protein
MNNLALALKLDGKLDQAAQLYREAGEPLIALYESWGKQDKANAIKAELEIVK